MKIMSTLKGLFADNESNVWFPRKVGTVLAVIFIVAQELAVLPFSPLLLYLWVALLVVIATAFFWKGKSGIIAIRWWARVTGVIMGLLILGLVISESSGGHGPPMTSIGDILSLVPVILIIAGIIVTFFWEGIGGAMTALGGLVAQGGDIVVSHGELNPIILVFVFVGLGSVYCWWRSRRLIEVQHAA